MAQEERAEAPAPVEADLPAPAAATLPAEIEAEPPTQIEATMPTQLEAGLPAPVEAKLAPDEDEVAPPAGLDRADAPDDADIDFSGPVERRTDSPWVIPDLDLSEYPLPPMGPPSLFPPALMEPEPPGPVGAAIDAVRRRFGVRRSDWGPPRRR